MKVDFTRDEAMKKCHGIAYPEAFIQALEALGLIEFKSEEHTPESVLRKSIHNQLISNNNVEPRLLLGALNAKGYRIIKA